MKPQKNQPTQNLSFQKKTIARLDQAQMSSLNGGAQPEQAGTTWTTTITTILIPGTETTVGTISTTAV